MLTLFFFGIFLSFSFYGVLDSIAGYDEFHECAIQEEYVGEET